ncbi:MAG: hypothetical protein ACR2NM_12920 [Bythopirellula sp.]
MTRTIAVTFLILSFSLLQVSQLGAQEVANQEVIKPTLKFFFFDERETEWVVSTEPDRMNSHFEEQEDSARLYESLQTSTQTPADSQSVRSTMSTWIEQEREHFRRSGSAGGQMIRIAEGVTAYIRAYDYDANQLVSALLRRSGASEVEVAAMHLIDTAGKSSYKLKVMLPSDQIDIDRQGVDVALNSAKVSHVSIVYALALALYEVHEIIEARSTGEPVEESGAEQLPVPEPGPLPNAAGPRLQTPGDRQRSVLVR